MLCVPVPTAVGLYETLHFPAFVPLLERLQVFELNAPVPLVENVTMPVGLVAPVEAVSVTIAVHEEVVPTSTEGGTHETAVDVGSTVTVWVMVAAGVWTVSERAVPTLSATRTQVLSGVATLLVAQPRAVG
jgi:hypothetical protein